MRSLQILTATSTFLALGTGLSHAAEVKKPLPPSNVKITPLGVNAFQMEWKDNSANETGFEIFVALKGTAPQRYAVAAANATSHYISTNDLPGKELNFQIRSYNVGAEAKTQYSKKTAIVGAKALSPSTFGAPTKLKAKTVDDGQIRLSWKDKSTSESGYQIEYKLKSKKKWKPLGTTQAGTSFNIPSYGYDPSKTYSFRVRAIKATTGAATAYTKEATATTKAFQAPTNLTLKSEGDGKFSFKWKDRSSLEAGYELWKKTGTGAFTLQGSVTTNTSSTTPVAFNPNTSYQFRLRGYRMVKSKKVYTAFTNTVSAKSSYLATPTSVVATAVSDTSATVTWKDVSGRETGYQVQARKEGETAFTDIGTVGGSIKTFTATKLVPGKNYEFRVRAVLSQFLSDTYYSLYSSAGTARTKDGIAGDLTPPIFWNTSFVYQIDVSRVSALSNLTVTGVPTGLTYNPGPRIITGTATEEGVKTIALAATFNDGSVINRNLVLRIIRPAADPVSVPLAPVQIVPGATSTIALATKFSDPDVAKAVRVATTKGSFDIILYPQATPKTVENFLKYVDTNAYNNSFFHRSVSNATLKIFQGGGYKYTSADGFKEVTKLAAVVNEPGISNLKGTVAMAKLGSDPNSATSQFFVNTDNVNAPNLDEQNEGFTVFGRVPAAGMTAAASIQALPTKSYTVSGFGSGIFDSVPMDATVAPAVMEPDKLVKITSVTNAPALSYQVSSNNQSVATVALNGTDLVITAMAAGSAVIEVIATDLDGRTTSQNVEVTVSAP